MSSSRLSVNDPNASHSDGRCNVYNLTFNDDGSCIVVGTSDGFGVYTCDPLTFQLFSRVGAVSVAHILQRTNVFVLLGGTWPTAVCPPNVALLWDEAQRGVVRQIFHEYPIQEVLIRDNLIATVCQATIRLHSCTMLPEVVELWAHPTGADPIAFSLGSSFLAVASHDREVNADVTTLFECKKVAASGHAPLNMRVVSEHRNPIRCVALSACGTLLATTSVNGTVVHVWDLSSPEKSLRQLRRAALTKAEVQCIAFNADSTLVACSGTFGIALWSLGGSQGTSSWWSTVASGDVPCASYVPDSTVSGFRSVVTFGSSRDIMTCVFSNSIVQRLRATPDSLSVVSSHSLSAT